jgi:uroporphyrinogen III methyltransferase/synthase
MDSAKQPLAGRRVVVTRAPEQVGELIGALERLGAEVLLLPTVEFAPPEDFSALDDAIARFAVFDWILFTSRNAVRFFARRLREKVEQRRTSELLARCRAAAVGPATAEAATKEGFRVDYVAENHSGEGLARELAGSVRGRRVLLPRSERADDRLPAALREAGAEVSEVVAYRTTAPKSLDPHALESVRGGEVDAVIFASPSAFHNLCGWIPANELAELSQRVEFAAIGPTTARALREAGAQVAIEAPDASASALAEAIASYYQRQPKKQPAAARRA